MSTLTLTPTKMHQGIWEAVAHQTGSGVPQIRVTHLGITVPDIEVKETQAPDEWQVKVPVPISAISEGVQVFLISDATDDTTIGQFTVIAGEVLGDDLRAEVELLRAELDMLKRAFRRHCAETS